MAKRKLRKEEEIARLERRQTPEAMRQVYDALYSHPQVRWKDSYQKALGIDALGRQQNPAQGKGRL